MTLAASNAAAAAHHVKRIVGPTILLGDGAYFDFEFPDASAMTIEDYAWGLAGTNRFRCQTRRRFADQPEGVGPRVLYNVCQHVVLLATQMLTDGHGPVAAYEGLMHESDEVVWGDFPGPGKSLMPASFLAIVKRAGESIDEHFDVSHSSKDLVKQYDIRMLATEKRDLMPHSGSDQWAFTRGYEPFPFHIECWSPEGAVDSFLSLFWRLRDLIA